MARVTRKSLFGTKNESVYGNDPGAWAATDFIPLRGQARHRIVRDTVARQILRPTLGGSEQMVASRAGQVEVEVEFSGSGTAGTAPAWGKMLRNCGMAETITAANRVEYTPAAGGGQSATNRYMIDGVKYVSRGARANVKFMLAGYEIPYMAFSYLGYDTAATAEALINPDYAAFRRPLVLSDANAGDIRLGGTYAAGVVSGGNVLKSRMLEIDLGNTLSHLKVLGGEEIEITARETVGKMQVFLTAAEEVQWRDDINNNVLTSLGFNFGTSAGNRVTIWAPAVQRVNPQPFDYEGIHGLECDLRLLPSALAANDELWIVSR